MFAWCVCVSAFVFVCVCVGACVCVCVCMAVSKDGRVAGLVPRDLSRICYLFEEAAQHDDLYSH